MKCVSLEKNERTAWVAMNRPEAMNSLTAELCAELVEAFAECERDAEIRAVVLTGSGRAFCAGGDLPTLAALKSREEAEEYVKTAGRVALAIVRSAKPYIAMVNGAAAGAGFNIALACDFLCASKNAKFTQAFSSIGLIADCGGNFLLPRLAGPREAKRLMMLPEKLTADDAEKLGLTTLVAEESELREKTAKLAARLAAMPPLALAEIKKFINEAELFEAALRREESIQSRLILGEECKEGITAFFEKRPPKF